MHYDKSMHDVSIHDFTSRSNLPLLSMIIEIGSGSKAIGQFNDLATRSGLADAIDDLVYGIDSYPSL